MYSARRPLLRSTSSMVGKKSNFASMSMRLGPKMNVARGVWTTNRSGFMMLIWVMTLSRKKGLSWAWPSKRRPASTAGSVSRSPSAGRRDKLTTSRGSLDPSAGVAGLKI